MPSFLLLMPWRKQQTDKQNVSLISYVAVQLPFNFLVTITKPQAQFKGFGVTNNQFSQFFIVLQRPERSNNS